MPNLFYSKKNPHIPVLQKYVKKIFFIIIIEKEKCFDAGNAFAIWFYVVEVHLFLIFSFFRSSTNIVKKLSENILKALASKALNKRAAIYTQL